MENLAPVKVEPLQLVGSEENELTQALTELRILASPLESLKEVLRYAIMKVGLKGDNWPSEEEKSLLVSHIISNYGTHTPAEVRLAFDMAITGKLLNEKDERLDATCYENFSCLYFSKIMNSYRKWAVQVFRFQENKMKNFKQLPSPTMSNEEIIENALGVWKATKRYEFISESCYDALVNSGKLNLSTPEKKKLMVAAEPTLVDMETRDSNSFHGGKREDYRKLFAKKLAVRNYFQKLEDDERNKDREFPVNCD